MEYIVEHEAHDKIVKMVISCLLDQAIRKEIVTVVAAELNKTGYAKVIMDVTDAVIDPEEPMVNALAMVEFMRSLGISSKVKWAFVYQDSERHRGFFENAAQADGMMLKYFKDYPTAKKWLNL